MEKKDGCDKKSDMGQYIVFPSVTVAPPIQERKDYETSVLSWSTLSPFQRVNKLLQNMWMQWYTSRYASIVCMYRLLDIRYE
jgi:hypothetical protein